MQKSTNQLNPLKSTDKNFKNKKGLVNQGSTGERGSSNQTLYRLRCEKCHTEYLCNGANIRAAYCKNCRESERAAKGLPPRSPKRTEKVSLDVSLGSDHYNKILDKCRQLIGFSTIRDIELEKWDKKTETAHAVVKLHCGVNINERLKVRGELFILDRGFHTKQLNGRKGNVLDEVIAKHGEAIAGLNPRGRVSKNVTDTRITMMVGNVSNSARYELDHWTLVPNKG